MLRDQLLRDVAACFFNWRSSAALSSIRRHPASELTNEDVVVKVPDEFAAATGSVNLDVKVLGGVDEERALLAEAQGTVVSSARHTCRGNFEAYKGMRCLYATRTTGIAFPSLCTQSSVSSRSVESSGAYCVASYKQSEHRMAVGCGPKSLRRSPLSPRSKRVNGRILCTLRLMA